MWRQFDAIDPDDDLRERLRKVEERFAYLQEEWGHTEYPTIKKQDKTQMAVENAGEKLERLRGKIKEQERLNEAIDKYHIQRCDAASDLTMALRALEAIGAIKLPTEHPKAQTEQSA